MNSMSDTLIPIYFFIAMVGVLSIGGILIASILLYKWSVTFTMFFKLALISLTVKMAFRCKGYRFENGEISHGGVGIKNLRTIIICKRWNKAINNFERKYPIWGYSWKTKYLNIFKEIYAENANEIKRSILTTSRFNNLKTL